MRPPGFWGPLARTLGDSTHSSAKDLMRGAWATVHGSLCMFALLTLLGSLLVPAPAPAWLPHGPAWLFGLALLSAASAWLTWRAIQSTSQEPAPVLTAGSST